MLLVSLRCYYHIVTNRTFYSSSILSPCLICLTISMASPHHENFPRGITGTFFLPSDPDKESLTVTRKWSLPREASFFVHIMVISIYFFILEQESKESPDPDFLARFPKGVWHSSFFFSAIMFRLICSWPSWRLFISAATASHPKRASSFYCWTSFHKIVTNFLLPLYSVACVKRFLQTLSSGVSLRKAKWQSIMGRAFWLAGRADGEDTFTNCLWPARWQCI